MKLSELMDRKRNNQLAYDEAKKKQEADNAMAAQYAEELAAYNQGGMPTPQPIPSMVPDYANMAIKPSFVASNAFNNSAAGAAFNELGLPSSKRVAPAINPDRSRATEAFNDTLSGAAFNDLGLPINRRVINNPPPPAPVQTPWGPTNPDTAKALMGQPMETPQFGIDGLPVQAPIQPEIPALLNPATQNPEPPKPELYPEVEIPEAYKGVFNKDQYKNFLMLSSHHPDAGAAYFKNMLDTKKTQLDMQKTQAETDKLLADTVEKDKTAAEARRLDMEIKKHSHVSNIFAAAKDKVTGDYEPKSVANAVTRARAMGFDVTRLPDNPSKDQIEDWIAEDIAMKKDSKSKDPYVEQKARFSQENDLRSSFQNQAKPFIVMRDQYSRLMSLDPTNPAGQIGLVYGIMKLYDPGSVVRESEYATAQNAAGVPVAVRNMWNKALSGEFLDETQIKQFKGQASNLYKSAEDNFNTLKNQYGKVSMDYGIKPTNVTGGLDIAKYKVEEVK
jgi:hypothetical protein